MLEDLGDVGRTRLDRHKFDGHGELSQIEPALVSTDDFEVRRKGTYYRQATNNFYCAIPR